MQRLSILTLFPEVITPYIQSSILKRAQDKGCLTIDAIDFRTYASNKHQKVDDIPFGGKTGMVIQLQPILAALSAVETPDSHRILFSPKGKPLTHNRIKELSLMPHLILIAGHYEGFDQRLNSSVDEIISIGDYVLTGGELPSLILADALCRLVPGVLGNTDSLEEDSFYSGLLDWDVFTRPQNFANLSVPDVLTSGNHNAVRLWKKQSALSNTLRYRPDLLARYQPTDEERRLLQKIWLEEATDEHNN